MGYKDKERQRAYQREHYQRNKGRWSDRLRRRRSSCRDLSRSLRLSCTCGEDDVRCLDFHHEGHKLIEIKKAVSNWSMTRMLSEIAKCTILCANCHAKQAKIVRIVTHPTASGTIRYHRNREWLAEYKKACYCQDCKLADQCCLVFHHTGPKWHSIWYLVAKGYSLTSIQRELQQCICLCANCHRKRHETQTELALRRAGSEKRPQFNPTR